MVAEIIDLEPNKRKLVTVRTIDALHPIEGADAIEVATVEGWKVVVKRGEFKAGDKCIYLEIDGFLPEGNPAWQFLVDKQPRIFEGVKGHRLRTVKFRGQISQGLVLQLTQVPVIQDVLNPNLNPNPEDPRWGCWYRLYEADDVCTVRDLDFSELLGVSKWEAALPAQLQGIAAGLFPSFIRKTDQPRCQNLVSKIFGYVDQLVELGITPDQLEPTALASGRVIVQDDRVFSVSPAQASPDDQYEVTMKLDGSSGTFFVQKVFINEQGGAFTSKVGVCSRNLELKVSEENAGNTFVRVGHDTGLFNALKGFFDATGRQIAVQGEVMGPNIQGNRENLKSVQFFVFDIFDIDAQQYVGQKDRLEIIDRLKGFGAINVKHVPILAYSAKLLDTLGIKDVDGLLKFAEGSSIAHPVREGVVFKRLDGKFSFKVISNKFLEREKD